MSAIEYVCWGIAALIGIFIAYQGFIIRRDRNKWNVPDPK